jgi:hypothetical protein
MGALRRPALPLRWLAFWDFIAIVCSIYNFGRVGGFH